MDGRPMNPKDEYKVIGPRKSNEVSKKAHWNTMLVKRAEEAQGK